MFVSFADALAGAFQAFINDRPPSENPPTPLFTFLDRAQTGSFDDQQRAEGERFTELAWRVAESPIEALIAPFLVHQYYGESFPRPVPVLLGRPMPELEPNELVIVPQLKVAGFRLDFAVCARLGDTQRVIAVECDGAEYHKDYRRDARRDLLLAACFGILTVRLRGTDIYTNPEGCSRQVGRAFADWEVTTLWGRQ